MSERIDTACGAVCEAGSVAGHNPSGTHHAIAEALRAFWRDEEGGTAIEYGLIVGLIFLAILGAVNNMATSTSEMYSEIESAMQ